VFQKWDLPSGCKPCVTVKQHWSLPAKKSSPQFNYFHSTSARWCSTGSLPPGPGVLSNSIPPPPSEATRNIFENLPSIPEPPEVLPPVEKVLQLAKVRFIQCEIVIVKVRDNYTFQTHCFENQEIYEQFFHGLFINC